MDKFQGKTEIRPAESTKYNNRLNRLRDMRVNYAVLYMGIRLEIVSM